jgi:hypothetical protein
MVYEKKIADFFRFNSCKRLFFFQIQPAIFSIPINTFFHIQIIEYFILFLQCLGMKLAYGSCFQRP